MIGFEDCVRLFAFIEYCSVEGINAVIGLDVIKVWEDSWLNGWERL